MDIINKKRRSENMRRIRSKNTKPELIVRKFVHSLGFRYRLHHKSLPGKPDLVFVGSSKIIFVHGCFWHQHGRCIDSRIPKSRLYYWLPKLSGNVTRDRANRRKLKKAGWKVLVIWDCETSNSDQLGSKIRNFLLKLE
jgi:DNA mismatch endonuclease, patch repair protein